MQRYESVYEKFYDSFRIFFSAVNQVASTRNLSRRENQITNFVVSKVYAQIIATLFTIGNIKNTATDQLITKQQETQSKAITGYQKR